MFKGAVQYGYFVEFYSLHPSAVVKHLQKYLFIKIEIVTSTAAKTQ